MKLPLRFTIPAILIIFTIALAMWSLKTNGYNAMRNVESSMLANLNSTLTILQEDVEHGFRKNDFQRVKRKVFSLGSDDNLKIVSLIDENDNILVESQFNIRRKYLASILPSEKNQREELLKNIITAKTKHSGVITLSHDKKTLWGIYPVVIGPKAGGLRLTRVGVLIAQADLVAPKAIALVLVRNQVVQFCFFLGVLVAGLGLFIYFKITLRIQNLVLATKSFAKGDYKTPIIIKGGDEITGLAKSMAEMGKMRQQTEEQIRKLYEELEQRVEQRTHELAVANEKLKELDRLKSMFLASMSHELRTPLNSIIGFTGILLQEMVGKLEPKQKDYLGRAYQSSKHLLGLINDVMDISKIESGTVEVSPELFNLSEVISEAVDFADVQELKSKGIELKVEIPSDLEMYSDRKRLLQCIINYLRNAVKFTQRGSILISAREAGDKVEIMVEDTGIGIAETDLHKLFQQFERLDSPMKVKAGGTGLGLYLTKKLATETLGGSVSVESKLDVGSKFIVKIPKNLKPQKSIP